jgi:hypothetical protein
MPERYNLSGSEEQEVKNQAAIIFCQLLYYTYIAVSDSQLW